MAANAVFLDSMSFMLVNVAKHRSLAAHFSMPDGSLIAGISEARRLVLCSIVEQTACDDLTPRHPGWGTDVAFSPDGKQLASTSYNAGGQDGGVGYIWDVATRTRVSVLEGHEERVSSIEFSPDGKSAVTASWDKTARLWNVADGSTRAVLRGHAGRVTAARFSPNGAWLATASYDRTASLWRAKPAGDGAGPGAPELHAKLVGHNRDVIEVAFSPDSRLLATGSFDGTVRLWETGQGTLRAVLRGDGSPIVKVTFSRDGSTLLAGATTGSVLRWTVSPIASAATEALVGIGRSLLPLPLVFDATATGLTNQIIRAPPETAECPLAVARSLGVPPHHVSGALRARRRDELPEVCIEQKARTASQAAFLEGSLHAFRGHTINARAKWREALGLGSVDALVALGDLALLDHGEQASADEAMRHYEQAATRGVSLAHARLGWLAAEREQAASAREHFARAADAAEPDGYAGLGWLEEQAAESSSGQLKTAFKSYAVAELLYGIRGERDKAAIIAEQRVRVAARLAHMELPDLLAEAVANASAARSRRSATPQDGPAQQGQPR